MNRYVSNRNKAKLGRNGNFNDSVGMMNTRVKRSRRGLPIRGKGKGAFSASNLNNPTISSNLKNSKLNDGVIKSKPPTNLTKLCNANMGKDGVVAFARNTDNLKRLNENGVKGILKKQLGAKNTFDPQVSMANYQSLANTNLGGDIATSNLVNGNNANMMNSSAVLNNSQVRDLAMVQSVVNSKLDRQIGTSKEPVINNRNMYQSNLHQRMNALAFSGAKETYKGYAQKVADLSSNPVNENRFLNQGVRRRTRTQKLASMAQNQKQGGLKLPYASRPW